MVLKVGLVALEDIEVAVAVEADAVAILTISAEANHAKGMLVKVRTGRATR